MYVACALKSFRNGQLLFGVDRLKCQNITHIQMSPARYYIRAGQTEPWRVGVGAGSEMTLQSANDKAD